jgi:hypothetical protein
MRVRQVVPRDAIPSVDDPVFGPDHAGAPDDELIVVDVSPPRGYPVRFLHYHEIVNDRLDRTIDTADGGRTDAIAVTWCPLCGSAVVYDRVVDGRVLTFGVSGKLADDDLVMYDRETGSEWRQSTGVCIAGSLEGERLGVLPSGLTTWEHFRESSPAGVVLQPPGGESEASGPGDDPREITYDTDPYEAYFDAEGFGLGAHRGTGGRQWDRGDLDPKAVVVGLAFDEEAVGVPVRAVEDAGGALTLRVGGRGVVVFVSLSGPHAFENPGFEFEAAGEGRFRGDGTTWDPATGEGADGRRLDRLPVRRLFAFAWQDDHGPDAFYEGE